MLSEREVVVDDVLEVQEPMHWTFITVKKVWFQLSGAAPAPRHTAAVSRTWVSEQRGGDAAEIPVSSQRKRK